MIIQISNTFEAIAIILGSLGVIGGALYWFYIRVLKPVHVIILAAANVITHELQPNSGGSFYDKVTLHLEEASRDREEFKAHLNNPEAHNVK